MMLVSRGPVYKTEQTATFQPHDACQCQPEPIFSPEGEWTPQAEEWQKQWKEAQRQARESGDLRRGTKNDGLNAFRRYLYNQ